MEKFQIFGSLVLRKKSCKSNDYYLGHACLFTDLEQLIFVVAIRL